MNRVELEARVAEKTGVSKKDVSEVLGAVLDSIQESLTKGDPVRLLGFGTFGVQDRKEREGKNPRTGEKLVIPPHRKPTFKPGKGLAAAING